MLRHSSSILAFTLALCASSALAADAGTIIFVSGSSELDSKAATVGATVAEGALLRTRGDGFMYVKTVDNGLFILRPNSEARVVTYQVDHANPGNTQVKFELVKGVARARSGDAVKAARQNFRFNTPVAAIGVRGTDFTVFTDSQTTSVTVLAGGVVVSGFGGSCRPEGAGPCEGTASRELFAAQKGQLLRVQRGKALPEILRGGDASPDEVSPPRNDEPEARGSGHSAMGQGPSLDPQKASNLGAVTTNLNKPPTGPGEDKPDGSLPPEELPDVVLPPEKPPVVVVPVDPIPVEPERKVIWGRWQPVLGKPAPINILTQNKKGDMVAMNGNFVLYRMPGKDYVAPERGTMGFKLMQSEVYMYTDYGSKRIESPATMSNGKLTVDFGARSFATSADVLVGRTEKFGLSAQGVLGNDGRLYGDAANGKAGVMNVQGLLGSEQNGSARYIFDARLDKNRTVNGGTLWQKQ
ncbi:FecR family protein [Pseudoduganella lutea]|uniref:FecR protein domain-containing protein n=1 Tax=Pseudoduganella lutea TaxID=321985 RepID=A0A4P6L080_9BURK|nr:FecR family protein [Pseudoduganella lutea]QBE64614.1 hypothetical protein EWM63_17800 [Pseudoduganella lutea]